MLVHFDFIFLHEGASSHISHTKFMAVLGALDGFVFPVQFFSQELDRGPEFLILLLEILELYATVANAWNSCLCLRLDAHQGWSGRCQVVIISRYDLV
jgi:hypothetical protein